MTMPTLECAIRDIFRPETARATVTLQEAAEILGVSYRTVLRMVDSGALRRGRGLSTIPRSEIDRILAVR